MSATGWIILDKPRGMFSRTAGSRVARMFGTKKFGHIGTLDEMATGVLAIAIGNATKMIPYVESRDGADEKEYLFSVQFGYTTDTLDTFGKITGRGGRIPETSEIINAIKNINGEIDQIPPVFSAVHIDGRRAYEIARRGANIEIPPRRVVIHSLEYTGKNADSFEFCVKCGRGTYVRALARDIAEKMGTIATVDMIRRVRSGGFDIKNAVKLDFLENLVNNGADIGEYLMPVDFGLADIPVLNLTDDAAAHFKCGGALKTTAADGTVRVYGCGVFIGMGTVANGKLSPKRIL